MPSSGMGDNFLNKPGVVGMDEFTKENWYSPTRIQFRELHGMLGFPVKNTKTLILAEQEETARKIIFVLSYFIRCSQIFEQNLKFEERTGETLSYSVKKKDITPRTGYDTQTMLRTKDSKASQITMLAKSSSSPVLERNLNFPKMKKSHSFICGLSDMDKIATESSQKISSEKVNFVIGEDENLNIKSNIIEEQFDSGLDVEDDINADMLNRLALQTSEDVIITKGVTVTMKYEPYLDDPVDEPDECINITEVPFTSPEVSGASPAPLPSLICCSDSYMTGTVLQGCHSQTSESWRTNLQSDLLATAANNFVTAVTEESICIVGDQTRKEVSLVSAQQVVVGRSGLPVPLSPLVASILDTFVSTAEFNLPASVVLNQLEDNLQQLYLQSCILAEYLLTAEEFINLQSIASVLDLDPCDIPLLLVSFLCIL